MSDEAVIPGVVLPFDDRQNAYQGAGKRANAKPSNGSAAVEDIPQSEPNLLTNDHGQTIPLLANAISVLEHSPQFKGVLAYDVFALAVVTKRSAPWQIRSGEEWTDNDDTRTCEWLQHKGVLVRTNIAAEAIQTVARKIRFILSGTISTDSFGMACRGLTAGCLCFWLPR